MAWSQSDSCAFVTRIVSTVGLPRFKRAARDIIYLGYIRLADRIDRTDQRAMLVERSGRSIDPT